MASSASKMTESAIKVKLMEAEDDPKKQMEMLESSSIQQAIGVFGFYGELETVGKLRAQHVRRIGKRGHMREFNASKSSTPDSGSGDGCAKCQEARSLTIADQQAVVTHGMTPKPAHKHCHRCGAVARADEPGICPACARPSICPARALPPAQQEPTTVDSESSDSSSSSDDGDLPFYRCSECKEAVVQGGGDILQCSTC